MKNPVKAMSFVDADPKNEAQRTYYHFSRVGSTDDLVEEVHSTIHGVLRSRNHPGFQAPHPQPKGEMREKMVARLDELRPIAKQALGVK